MHCIFLATVDVENDYVVDENTAEMIAVELDHDEFRFKYFLYVQYADELNRFVDYGMSDNACVMVLFAKAQYKNLTW